jgi:hypothetical protein
MLETDLGLIEGNNLNFAKIPKKITNMPATVAKRLAKI